VPGPGGEEIVGISQYFLDPKSMAAEVAFIVQDEWQQKGMGTILLRYLTEIARARGVRRFYAKVLRANRAMLAIFENCGYELHKDLDSGTYSLWYDLAEEE